MKKISKLSLYFASLFAMFSIFNGCKPEKPTPTTGTINGYEWVDLGLPSGLKWATCNVGAYSPEQYGEYYAWGMTTTPPDNNYSDDNCSTYGVEMSDISGNAQYDVARNKWGSTWRMPTRTEFEELIGYCTWTWSTQGDINGYMVTGNNGNHIFLPAAGTHVGTSHHYIGIQVEYSSSTPYESNNTGVYALHLNKSYQFCLNFSRADGNPIRPVSE